MKAGLWQILIWIGLIVFFFGPLLLRLVRIFSSRGNDEKKKIDRQMPGAFKCPKCGERLRSDVKFCSNCGASVEAINV